MAKATKNCVFCKKEFHLNTSPANIERQLFCSRYCVAQSLKDIEPFEVKMRRVLLERSEVQENGCILYTGQSWGKYGQIEYKRKTYLTHRVSFMINKGEIKKGNMICHTCDTPLCINPDHLFQGTGSDNVQDMLSKGRQNYNPRKKLSGENLALLLKEITLFPQKVLAEKYGICKSYVSHLKNGVRRSRSYPASAKNLDSDLKQ